MSRWDRCCSRLCRRFGACRRVSAPDPLSCPDASINDCRGKVCGDCAADPCWQSERPAPTFQAIPMCFVAREARGDLAPPVAQADLFRS